MTKSDQWLAWAAYYIWDKKFSVIPMNGKKPLVKWMEFQSRRPKMSEILSWPRENLAIVTGSISGIAVVDCESAEDATWFWNNRGKSPWIVKSKRGYHFYFKFPQSGVIQNAQKVRDADGRPRYDVRSQGGYVCCPPSAGYSWHKMEGDVANLPVFQPEWRPPTNSDNFGKVKDAAKYIQSIQATQGANGSAATFRAACVLKESGLSEAEAYVALYDWNKTNATPPWSDRELLHKVKSAFCS